MNANKAFWNLSCEVALGEKKTEISAQPTENANELSDWNDNWLDREDEVAWSAFAFADEEGLLHAPMKPAVKVSSTNKTPVT